MNIFPVRFYDTYTTLWYLSYLSVIFLFFIIIRYFFSSPQNPDIIIIIMRIGSRVACKIFEIDLFGLLLYLYIYISRTPVLSPALATCTTMTSSQGARDTQVCTLFKKPFSSNNLVGDIYIISTTYPWCVGGSSVVRSRVLLFHLFIWKIKTIRIQIYKHKSMSRWLWNRFNSHIIVFDKAGQVNENTFWG